MMTTLILIIQAIKLHQRPNTMSPLPWNSHLMSHLNTSAISCGVQPTASRPAHIDPALLPAIRFTCFIIPASVSAYKTSQMHTQYHSQISIIAFLACDWRKQITVNLRLLLALIEVCTLCFKKNVTLSTFMITSSDVARFSWFWTWL